MKKLLVAMLISGIPLSGAAQSPEDGNGGGQGGLPRWGVGVASVISDSPYAGEGTKVLPIPLVTFEGERFYFRGVTAGWRFVRNDSFELAGIAKLRFDGFNVDDLGRTELATNGINAALLEDRDLGLDAGIGVKWTGAAGEIEMEFLADATDTSGGQEITLQYGHPFRVGNGRLTPSIGATWQSDDMANYYYGTLNTEVARGVANYKPGSVVTPYAGIQYFRPIGDRWALLAFAKYSVLPDELTASPLLEPESDGVTSVFLGFSRGF
jgi:outer membrane protein